MDELRALLENYWLRREDIDIFTRAKRAYPKYRKFITEQLGWKLVSNERILKLEKVPAHAETFMGIDSFSDINDYCMLCGLLMYLEDKEDDEQFLLSELVEQMSLQLRNVMEVDWTQYIQRKSLIRVLQYAETMGMLAVYEGDSNEISGGMNHEVLYENTGLSRYFATTFDYDITDCKTYQDLENIALQSMEADRGYLRINRVYRQLAAAPAMYWSSVDDQDSLYVKNQRQWVQHYLDEYIGGKLEIHRNAAFFVMEEGDCFGSRHPKDAMLPELVMMICREIRQEIKEGVLLRESDDTVSLDQRHFYHLLSVCKEKYDAGWSKEYRAMNMEKLLAEVSEYMVNWMMLKKVDGMFRIFPGTGKVTGRYPKDFKKRVVDIND
jgi:uncharacterized protein (TIGR02678 family)